MKMIIKRGLYPNDYYDTLDGDTPFAKAVNNVIGDYWVSTGGVMPVETAAFEVLADWFDRENPVNKP